MLPLLLITALAQVACQGLHIVQVGAEGSRFDPDVTTAAIGDNVIFQFVNNSVPHNVARADFSKPCKPSVTSLIWSTTLGAGDSFTITVRDDKPIWYYCAVSRHCPDGMVGVINPGSLSLDTFKQKAATEQTVFAPGSTAALGGSISGARSTVDATPVKASAAQTSQTASTSAAVGLDWSAIIFLPIIAMIV